MSHAVFALQWFQVENWIITWAPIIFMGLLVFFLWRTLKLMPKTKPTEITPDSASAVEWSQVAGADEAKAELQEVVDFLKDPKRFHAIGATVSIAPVSPRSRMGVWGQDPIRRMS